MKEKGKEKKEQEKSSFLPPGRSVKPNQCLARQCGSSPRHRLTMEARAAPPHLSLQICILRDGPESQEAACRGTTMPRKRFKFFQRGGQKKEKNYLSVSRIGLTSKSENESSFRSLHVDMDG